MVKISLKNLLFLSIGLALNCLSYSSLLPGIVVALFYIFGRLLLPVMNLSTRSLRVFYVDFFSLLFFISGIAALYVEGFGDPNQLEGDPGWIYQESIKNFDSASANIKSGGVIIFSYIYTFFNFFYFPKSRYIGVFANILFVSLASTIGLKSADIIFNNDVFRFNILKKLIMYCPLLWLFGTTHLRDSMTFLLLSIFTFSWVLVFKKNSFANLVKLLFLNISVYFILSNVRSEYQGLILVIALMGSSILLFVVSREKKLLPLYFISLSILVLVSSFTFSDVLKDLLFGLQHANEYYYELTKNSKSSGLGFRLIVDQPFPIRLSVGFFYIFLFPIPFWAGSPLYEVYDLFKSLNALYFYVVFPGLALGIIKIIKNIKKETPVIIFVFLFMLTAVSSVIMTSLETRHLGSFVLLVFIISLVPNYNQYNGFNNYKVAFFILLGFMSVVHFLRIGVSSL